jgi:hypothetical protein
VAKLHHRTQTLASLAGYNNLPPVLELLEGPASIFSPILRRRYEGV